MRKLATIQKVAEIKPIPDADRIDAYRINGWWVVDQKEKYQVGDLVVYIEPDAWVPHSLAPFLCRGKEPREYNGVPGEKLRTIRLKKQLSQGLLLPVDVLPFDDYDEGQELSEFYFVGHNVTDMLGIQKWEPAENPHLAGQMKGYFPSFLVKTDQERVQNLVTEIKEASEKGLLFEVTEKLEGSSMTCYLIGKEVDGEEDRSWEFGVCSRNVDLKKDPENSFWKKAIELEIEEKMLSFSRDFAIQGELVGPGIQGNIYGLNANDFYVFDVYDIAAGRYLNPTERLELIEAMGLKHVPVLNSSTPCMPTVDGNLALADGKSRLANTAREGIVFKEINGGMTFKAVSNDYLLKQKG